MKNVILFTCILLSTYSFSQNYIENINQERKSHQEYIFSDSSFLNKEEQEHLLQLNYYPADSNWIITANFKKKKGKKFEMQTSTDRKPIYRQYGILSFKIADSLIEIPIYQNLGLLKKKEYKDYLFLPLRDKTAPKDTYGAGRYLELKRTKKQKTMVLDFNQLFNPYCAFSYRYSCPVTPKANWIDVKIEAGEKLPSKK